MDSFETLTNALDKTDTLPDSSFGKEEALASDLPQNLESATGEALDPLLKPPVSGKDIVQNLKAKIDEFVYKVATYQGSKKQLQEVMATLAMHPFMEKKPSFGYPAQTPLYELGTEILTEKLLFLQVGMKEQEEAKALRTKDVPETENPKIWENLEKEVQTEGLDNPKGEASGKEI